MPTIVERWRADIADRRIPGAWRQRWYQWPRVAFFVIALVIAALHFAGVFE